LSNLSLSDEAGDTARPLPRPKALNLPRPELSQRSTTEPSPSALLQSYFANQQQAPRPNSSHRNRSPYSRSHLRSRSSGAAFLSAPAMTRAHSMPNPHLSRMSDGNSASSSGSLSPGGPHSPMRSPARTRSPLQHEDGAYLPPKSPAFSHSMGGIESIDEDSELDTTANSRDTLSPLPQTPAASSMASFTRSGSLRRRPASPLHSLAQVPPQAAQAAASLAANTFLDSSSGSTNNSAISSGANSPSLLPQRPEKFNEAYPSLHHYASSSSFSSLHSLPSTPTSARSRSPSISSLDTIEDAPDLESEAVEAERIQRLKLAAERQERLERGEDVDNVDVDDVGSGGRRRGSFEGQRSGVGFGFGRSGGSRTGSASERKRWSVCGGERRGDLLDLETIWED
jgi:hypothetical protein